MAAYESNVSEMPEPGEIIDALDSLKAPMTKMKFRDLASAKWPQHERYIRMSAAEFERDITEAANASGMAPAAGAPSAEEVIGVKWSDTIECLVDIDATDDEVSSIANEGQAYAIVQIGTLVNDYSDLLTRGDIKEADWAARRMAGTEAGLRELTESDGHGAFTRIEEGTSEESWGGNDGVKAREQYGSTVRNAADRHLNMANLLLVAAVDEIAQRSRIYTELASAINEAGDRVEELTNTPAVRAPLIKSIGIGIGSASLIVAFTGPVGWVISAIGFAIGFIPASWDVEVPLTSSIESIMTRKEAEEILADLKAAAADAKEIYESNVESSRQLLEEQFRSFSEYKNDPMIIPGQGY